MSRGFEKASEQVKRERKRRKDKRERRRRRRMQILMRSAAWIDNERRAMDKKMKSASIWKRIQWWFIKAWRKMFAIG